ncbi:hypothetical protein A0H76_928 [Hepatospora eriocheir]|uniref:Uncharacterized protein n=1 Tax=Hepatospora eriocheir TaxID=1081669 RepID=A0A1X0QL35_9MICR|nr:hypothetical protein A0H76_928 [Hepatospora eriocheir]
MPSVNKITKFSNLLFKLFDVTLDEYKSLLIECNGYMREFNIDKSNRRSYIDNILKILLRVPLISNDLVSNKKFINNLILSLNNKDLFNTSIEVLIIIMNTVKNVPDVIKSKKFIFFIINKLFLSLVIKEDIKSDLDILNEENIKVSNLNDLSRLIIRFINCLLVNSKSSISICYSLGLFKLLNSLICYEVLELYNNIFKNIEINIFYMNKEEVFNKERITNNEIYEINRKYFDTEIVFRNKKIFRYKTNDSFSNSIIYMEIYKNCLETNLFHFIDLSPIGLINMINYKVLNNNNINNSLLTSFIQMFQDEKNIKSNTDDINMIVRYFRRVALSNFRNGDKLLFDDESKHLFGKKLVSLINNTNKGVLIRNSVIILSFLNYHTNLDINKLFKTLEYKCEYIEEDVCECAFIVNLLFNYYNKENKLFYKPSYLILLRNIRDHLIEFNYLIDEYFTDFNEFVLQNDNVMKIFVNK